MRHLGLMEILLYKPDRIELEISKSLNFAFCLKTGLQAAAAPCAQYGLVRNPALCVIRYDVMVIETPAAAQQHWDSSTPIQVWTAPPR